MKKFILFLLCVVIIATTLLCFGCRSNEELLSISIDNISDNNITATIKNISENPIEYSDMIFSYEYNNEQLSYYVTQYAYHYDSVGRSYILSSGKTDTVLLHSEERIPQDTIIKFWNNDKLVATYILTDDDYITQDS